MNVVALAGGVGGAKLVDGLVQNLPANSLTIVVNTGDDFNHFGLRICPDLDTVCYTLAGISNPATGWGREAETWNALASIEQLGGPSWFRLGDRDLGTHLERTRLLGKGKTLSEICYEFCGKWKIEVLVLPMSNDLVATVVLSEQGELGFQDYFVKRKCEPEVYGFKFEGATAALPAPGVLESLRNADLVVICPSNPWVSIDPILAVPGIREEMVSGEKNIEVLAVSPIIQGRALKGPAAKMFAELGINPSAASVAQHYGSIAEGGILSGFVLDDLDHEEEVKIKQMGIKTLVKNTIMDTRADRSSLARQVIEFGGSMLGNHTVSSR